MAQLLSLNQDYFIGKFQLIVACQTVSHDEVVKLSQLAELHAIPLILLQTHGFVACECLKLPQHCVVDTHAENVKDLRLDKPFAELQKLADTVSLDASIDSMVVAHIPFPLLLLHLVPQWDGGRLPATYQDKQQCKKFIMSRAPATDTENFEEACANLFRVVPTVHKSPTGNVIPVPFLLWSLLQSDDCQKLTTRSDSFWLQCHALSQFVDQHNELPLHGQVPDMKADTDRYIAL